MSKRGRESETPIGTFSTHDHGWLLQFISWLKSDSPLITGCIYMQKCSKTLHNQKILRTSEPRSNNTVPNDCRNDSAHLQHNREQEMSHLQLFCLRREPLFRIQLQRNVDEWMDLFLYSLSVFLSHLAVVFFCFLIC